MQEAIDFNALNWVRQELGDTLKLANQQLNAYASSQDDVDSLVACAALLHQVRGPLRMVDLKGADRLAAEMEEVVADLQQGGFEHPDAALDVLLQAFLQLPDYLSRLHRESRDVPAALLPVINSLRAVRGVESLHDRSVFSPDISVPAPDAVFNIRSVPVNLDVPKMARAARVKFQAGLLEWYRGSEGSAGLQALRDVLEHLQHNAGREPVARLWWTAAALVDGLLDGAVCEIPEIKQLFGRIDRQIKRLLDSGEVVFADSFTNELLLDILFEIAAVQTSPGILGDVREHYRIAAPAVEDKDTDSVEDSLGGCNNELLQTVSVTALADLEKIREQLDIFNRAVAPRADELAPIADAIHALANTLCMTGMDAVAATVVPREQLLRAALDEGRVPDEAALMDIANTLISVENALQGMAGNDVTAVHVVDETWHQGLYAVARTVIADISNAKEILNEFSKMPGEFSILEPVPVLLTQIHGSLQLAGEARAAVAIAGIDSFINETLLQRETALEESQLDALADAICSVEYYIEGLAENPVYSDMVLEIAEKSLVLLNESVCVSAESAKEVLEQQSEPDVCQPINIDIPADAPVITELQVIGSDVDAEILEIFIEEADDQLASLRQQIPAWAADVDNTGALGSVCRSYHSLKGNGRMLGALAVSEFAWAFENLINQVIEGVVAPGKQLFQQLSQSLPALEQLMAQVKGDAGAVELDVNTLAGHVLLLSRNVDIGVPVENTVPAEQEDDSLLKIFRDECHEHLAVVSRFLEAESAPIEISEPLYRALHTLSGISGSAAVQPVGQLAGALNSYFDEHYHARLPVGEEALDVLRDSVDELLCQLERLPDLAEGSDGLAQLCERIAGLPHEVSVETDAVDSVVTPDPEEDVEASNDDPYAHMDPELFEVFIEEASELIDGGETTLRAWSETPQDVSLVAEFQRQLHTLKGGARMLDIVVMGDLSHSLESLVTRVTEGELQASESLFGLLHETHDRLAEMLELVKARVALEAAGELEARINDWSEPVEVGAAEPASRKEPETDAVNEIEATETEVAEVETEAAVVNLQGTPEEVPAAEAEAPASEETGDVADSLPLPAAAPAPKPPPVERRKASRARTEQVRVQAGLLDDMVNYAGEINIYRSRMEQQASDYRFHLDELGQTINRLHEQLRQLEMETEAHILHRHEREHDGRNEDFDPLEMDRYSVLQQLSRSLMESINDLGSIRELMGSTTRESETLLLQQSRVSTDLQEGLIHSRMTPFAGLAPRLRRIVRQSAKQLDKRVELSLDGAEGEMDRSVIDRIVAPLEHMLRNAVAHGIEYPDIRTDAGKEPAGAIAISFSREGPEIVLRIRDDGAGMDIDAIRKRAVDRGLMQADEKLSDADIMQFILQTGFSTATEVTQIAGRGVGLDVVNSEVKQLGGSLRIDSVAGKGSEFIVRLPYTLALNHALLVRAGEQSFCVPLASVEGVVRASGEELVAVYEDEAAILEYAGNSYQLKHLGSLLDSGGVDMKRMPSQVPVLLVRSADKRVALQVEEVMSSREIVVKPLGAQLSQVNGISGATILGDGSVVMILDIAALSRMQTRVRILDTAAPASEQRLTIMVVDDSITVRKVTTRLLERNGYRVITASDGVDAMGQLQDAVPDIMLLDIEMPRMDGFELATHMRNDERLKHLPVIMITSRTGDKHRERARQIGVSNYLGKPYQENKLLDSIHEIIGGNSTSFA